MSLKIENKINETKEILVTLDTPIGTMRGKAEQAGPGRVMVSLNDARSSFEFFVGSGPTIPTAIANGIARAHHQISKRSTELQAIEDAMKGGEL